MSSHPVRLLSLAVLVLMLAACGKSSSGRVTAAGDKADAGKKMTVDSMWTTNMPDVAKKYNCNACHAIDKKVVGPAWIDISRKYKGDGGAAARLSDKITKGGSGAWGAMPMPPNPNVGEAEKKALVDFILRLAK